MSSDRNPTLRSFLPIAADSHFPLQNLPLGVFRPTPDAESRVGAAIGEWVLDLAALERGRLLAVPALAGVHEAFARSSLNLFLSLGPPAWEQVRTRITRLLSHDEPTLRDDAALRREVLTPIKDVELLLPVEIGDYTDFYSSREHATNVGEMLRGSDNALMPNWLHLPVAYHGRASSVVVSGTDIRRPSGQTKSDTAASPSFGPTRALDFELEMGLVIGTGNTLGTPIPVGRAAEHVFGLVLVNDWSARDIQKWEYAPLGPFLAKNFATSISPWVVPLAALEPFRVAGPVQEPQPLPYLQSLDNWAYDIHLEVSLSATGASPQTICRSNYRHLYWNLCQQIAHHTVNGCNLKTGDLLASGTISGPEKDARGSMLELTWGGREPIELRSGGIRRFLEDSDRITMTGWCQADGYRIGFGEVTGEVLPAHAT